MENTSFPNWRWPGGFHFYFIKVEPSDMLDFDGTEHGTQNSAIFDLGICFLWKTGSSDF
ncbi:hypothetical protein RhiirA5_501348 [Rhizophagus irregularis]|uniref:Uncharacterized protein n=1 Tax=Rhizophagus irregularis TaxID=588596 RepID=A0A2N0PI35_9GLOM|nr:hypothetical protein RhiirA5_505096 [Rhizophagus irregularis]PKC06491.1 hypothetical protein RhiirA5_501348 [Rhizophagus irregularis]